MLLEITKHILRFAIIQPLARRRSPAWGRDCAMLSRYDAKLTFRWCKTV